LTADVPPVMWPWIIGIGPAGPAIIVSVAFEMVVHTV
jgi:hypothetical protein